MTEEITNGRRITSDFGAGTVKVANWYNIPGFCIVEFDTPPPVAFNMGENPSLVLTAMLTPLSEEE